MSPRRWGVNTRLWAYRYLVLRDGEQCARCFETPTTQNTLDIDHIDGDPQNNDPDNLRLLCRGCNVTLSNQARSPSDQNVCVCPRERQEGKPATRIVREEVDYKQGEAAMQANLLFENDFRAWLLSQIKEKDYIAKDDAINAGAEQVGCSPATTERYIRKLTSSVGPLQEVRDLLKRLILTWKDSLQPEPTEKVDLDLKKVKK